MPVLPKISPDLIQKYQEEISKNSSEATYKRKAASLNRFFGWAQAEGHIDANPMPPSPSNQNGEYVATKTKSSKKIGLRTWTILGTTLGIIILIFLLTWKLKFPIEFIKNFAAGVNNNPTAEININGQNALPSSAPESTISAKLAGNGLWNLYAGLKLTDDAGAPQVGSQTITFKVYNSQSGGSPLYTEGPQTVTTDSNGSALISLDKVPSDLFFQNRELFLESEIGSASASTRIPISTANIAANLGGYFPANPDTGATALTVPVIDGSGSLNLASESPAINAKAGNLLVQGQAVTVKTVDGGNGNIEINPDGSGIAHFLFEGSTGNFLNAQAPNLNSGSLYYGIVANNSISYDLLKLQSGSSPTTKFRVDSQGNTTAKGSINTTNGGFQTSGITRLSNLGRLSSITGYYQDSGNFGINQGAPDTATITKTLTSTTGSALAEVLNLTLDETTLSTGSNESTLVLNRLGGTNSAMALLVDNGNAEFDGQLRLGNFTTNPGSVGKGSLIYNTTDNKVYVWDGTAWVAVGTGTVSFDNITSGTNTTAAMVVDTGASLTYSGGGTINASTLNSIASSSFLRSDTSDNFTSGTLTTDAGTTLDVNGDLIVSDPNIAFDAANTTLTTTGDLTLNIGGGDLILSDTQTINIGGNGSDVAYNAIADSVAGASANMTSDKDLYVQGNLEVDGTIYGATVNPAFTPGSVVFAGASGELAQDNTNFFWDNATDRLGIGTASPGELLSLGSNGGSKGVISLAGDTSGKVIVQPAAAAGSWSLTLPIDTGTSNTVLTTDGTGITSWQPIPTAGILTYYLQDTASDVGGYRKQLISPYSPKTTLTTAGLGAGDSVLGNWITAPGSPGLTSIPAGTFDFHIHAAKTAGVTKTAVVYAEIWEANSSGVDIALIGTTESSPVLTGSELEYDLHLVTSNTYTLASQNSRITTRVHTVVTGGGPTATVALYYGGTADSHTALPSQTIDASNFVPYIGATTDVNLGVYNLSGTTLNGTTGINTGAGAGTQRIDSSGNVTALDVAVNGGNITSTGSLDINSATTNAITLDSGSTGAVNIGNNANAKTITIGNATGGTNVVLTKGAAGNIIFTGFNCSGLTNGGALTADASGNVTCSDDDGGAGATNVPWSGLTSPSANLTLDHTSAGQYTTTMNWTATGALSPWTMNLINNAGSSTTQNFVTIANAVTTQTTDVNTEALLVLDNADTTGTGSTIVDNAILITDSGTIANGVVDAIDASDANITNALNAGANNIIGTTGDINLNNFDVTGSTGDITTAGDIYVNGNDINTAAGNLNLQPAGAGTIANVQIGIGGAGSVTPDYLALDVKSDTGDPAGGAEGYMYYNTFDNKFRCFQNAAWTDCVGGTPALQDVYNNDVDGGDAIIALTTADDSLIFRNPAAAGTDSSFILKLDQLADAAVDGLQIAQAGTGAGLNMDFTNAGTTANGILITTTNALTDAIDVSDADIVNAINVGTNTILGTSAVIDFTAFDVDASGNAKALTLALGTGTIARTDRLLDANQSTALGTTANTYTETIQRTLTGTAGANISTYNSYNSMVINGTDDTFVHASAGLYSDVILSTGNTIDAMYGGLFYATNNSATTSPDSPNYTATTSAAVRGIAINSGTGKIGTQTGGFFNSYLNSAGTITTANGVFSSAYTQNASGTLTSAFGNSGNVYTNIDGSSITNAYGAYGNAYELVAQSTGGITTGYGGYFTAEDATTTYGVYALGKQNTANTETFTNLYGVYGDCQITAVAPTGGNNVTVSNCYGVRGNITENTGTITNAFAGYFGSASAVGTGYGVYSTLTGASTTSYGTYSLLTNAATQYGLWSSVTSAAAGTAYALYADAGTGAGTEYAGIFLNGNVGIGDTTPVATLTVGDTDLFQVAGATGNMTTAGDIYVNGGDINTAAGNLTLQPAGAATIANVQIGVGGAGSTTPDFLGLDVKSDTGDPLGGFEGAMYYNTFDNKFRCYQGAAWADCVGGSGSSNWTLNAVDGTLYPISNTADVLIGSDASASAKFAFTNVAAGTPVFQTTGVIQTGAVTSPTTLAYNSLGTTATSHSLATTSDLLVGGTLELDGTLYLDNGQIAGIYGPGTVHVSLTATPITAHDTLDLTSWLVHNSANVGEAALMVNQDKGGAIFSASSSSATKFTIANNGNVTISGSGTMLTVGGGTGKVDMGTVDPVYNIDGTKYATYLSGMVGVKEETTGTLQTSEYIAGVGYRQVLDFKNLGVGSDLWLFSQAVGIKDHIGQMMVLLSPTDNTRTWYQIDENNYTVSIYSDRPTKVSYRFSSPRFDAETWSNFNDSPDSTGFEIHTTPLVGSGETQNPIGLTFADFRIVKDIGSGIYKLYQNIADGGQIAIEEFGSFANLIAGNIRAGITQTALISPLPDGTDVTVRIGSEATPSGKFAIQNSEGTEVASIDNQGNATFSGIVRSQNIDTIQELLTQVTADQSVLLSAMAGVNFNATGSATLSELITSDLYVTSQAAMNSLSVTNSVAIGPDLIIGQDGSTINSLSSPLKLQSLALAPVEIMAGLVTIDTHGNVNIAGDLVVAGRIKSSGLTLKGDSPELLNLQDSEGQQVAGVNASGSASFHDLTVGGFAVASDASASDSAVINGVITTNATAGKATIPTGVTEITIKNPKVSDYTLVYITPTSPTLNNVLYVKSKEAGQFVVGFTDPTSIDVSFNWWIIEIK